MACTYAISVEDSGTSDLNLIISLLVFWLLESIINTHGILLSYAPSCHWSSNENFLAGI